MEITDIALQDFLNEAREELKRFQSVGIGVATDLEKDESVYPLLVTLTEPTLPVLKQIVEDGYHLVGLLCLDPIWADNAPAGYYIRPFSMAMGSYKHLLTLLRNTIENSEDWRKNEDR
jgi:hypothetical protein